MFRTSSSKTIAAMTLFMFMATSMLVMIPGTTHAAPGDGWIEGTVSDGVNPIPNVLLIYILNMGGGGNPLGAGSTDALGYYNLTVAGGLDYMVLAFEGSHYSSASTASVVSGATAIADIVMMPIAPTVADVTLHGFVKNETGSPVTVGTIVGFTNDPNMTGGGPPYYGNTTVPDGLGQYSVNVIAGTAGGGVGIMGVPGYGFIDNGTSNPFISGMSYWLNLTLAHSISTDDAVFRGTVTDSVTGLPLEGVFVNLESSNAWNQNRSYSNYTFTDSLGYYEMNVTNGTSRMMYSKVGYSMIEVKDVQINSSDVMTIDVQLKQIVATIRGNVTDKSDDSPIANAQVFLTDMAGNFTMTYTNSSGAYVLDAFAGTGLAIGAQADGYARDVVMGNVSPGDTLWQNFRLGHLDAWMTGRITDAITGAPIENANINVYNGSYNEWKNTNIAGDYNITALMSGNYSVSVNAMNYRQFVGEVQVLPGGNVYDVQLMPWNIPDTCLLWGYVNDSTSMVGISNARVEVGTGPPDYSERNTTFANATGYYAMWIPPMPLTYVASADDHIHKQGPLNASGRTNLQLDIALDTDLWQPNMTYSQSPLGNVSWTNPSVYNISIQELDPSMFALSQFMYLNSSMDRDNYYLLAMYYDGFDPLNNPSTGLPYSSSGDNYTIDLSWDATTDAGWLWNGTAQQYFGSYVLNRGPDTYDALRANYTNSSMGMGSWQTGTVLFDRSTGDFAWFQFDGPSPDAYASDPTGMISPLVHELQVDPINNSTMWMPDMMMGQWSVVNLKFQYNPQVPSGRWISVFSVSDFGGHGNGMISFFTVDNDPPVADAGSDRQAIQNITAYLDGGNCSDNVGIVDYAWSFWDDSTYYEIHGAVVIFSFTELGDHNVTLTVTDGAGHVSSANIVITVVTDPPPVPYAGPDQLVLPGTVSFDASGSYDVGGGIVNWTWTFTYDGDVQTLWGPIPTFDFLIEGVYNVTLTVMDTAGQNSTDTVQITVASVIPEFPTLLIPISGMLLLMVIVGTIRRRRR
jgi:hypothetical protein